MRSFTVAVARFDVLVSAGSAGDSTSVLSVSELLDVLRSGVSLETEAELTIVPVSPGMTVIVPATLLLAATVPNEQPVAEQPELALWNVTDVGNVSATVTLLASSGPALNT